MTMLGQMRCHAATLAGSMNGPRITCATIRTNTVTANSSPQPDYFTREAIRHTYHAGKLTNPSRSDIYTLKYLALRRKSDADRRLDGRGGDGEQGDGEREHDGFHSTAYRSSMR